MSDKSSCWDCFHLGATAGGWHCDEHNIFLHEQIKKNDVGHGGNGCGKFNTIAIKICPPIREINFDLVLK